MISINITHPYVAGTVLNTTSIYFLFTFIRMNLDLKAYTEWGKKEAVRDKSGSSVSIDFLRIDNEYFLIKTEIHTH